MNDEAKKIAASLSQTLEITLDDWLRSVAPISILPVPTLPEMLREMAGELTARAAKLEERVEPSVCAAMVKTGTTHPAERRCGEPAKFKVQWPGQDEICMCDAHEAWASKVASAMGFKLAKAALR